MKGQLWSFDMAASVVIFFSALVAFMFAWNYMAMQNSQDTDMKEMNTLAMMLSDQLVRTPGIPSDWTSSTVSSIGLASGENVLNATKLGELLNLDYGSAKTMLGLARYEMLIEVNYTDGTPVYVGGRQVSYGNAASGAVTVVPVDRRALLDGKVVGLRLTLWSA
jgi:hypothetical protein